MKTERDIMIFYARIAGLSYVVFTVSGLIKNFLLNTKLSAVNEIQTNSIFVNEIYFRFGIGAEILIFLATLMASVAFYIVLKPVNKQLALLALCLRLCEIILGGFVVIVSMTMLTVSVKTYYTEIFDLEQLRMIVAVLSGLRMPAYEYSWIFMGFAGVITFYLFLKSRYIPVFWSVWGIFTYSSLVIYPVAKVLIPDLPKEVMFVMYPGALFELGVGIWLLTIGIKLPSNSEGFSNMPTQQSTANNSAA